MNSQCVIAQRRTTLAQELSAMQVGECRQLDYGRAKSCITQLRSMRDGRKWSLVSDESIFCIRRVK